MKCEEGKLIGVEDAAKHLLNAERCLVIRTMVYLFARRSN